MVLTDSFFIFKCLYFTPQCEENLKPKLGMTFEELEAVEKFYKCYAHEPGFGVRVGHQKKLDNEVVRKQMVHHESCKPCKKKHGNANNDL